MGGCIINKCSLEQVLAGTACDRDSTFLDPANTQGEQFVYDIAYKDLINNYGITINYYINCFNLSAADTLYGEHTLQEFYGPVEVKAYIELNDANIALSKYGFDPADELTAFLHIRTFFSVFSSLSVYSANGQRVEPKSGDLIELTPLGCDRPNDRGPKIFEITERMDQDVSQINPLLGHYVYRVKAKRFEYTYETNAPHEKANDQLAEGMIMGKLSSALFPQLTSEEKVYPNEIDETSKDVYDMDKNNTSIYGNYY